MCNLIFVYRQPLPLLIQLLLSVLSTVSIPVTNIMYGCDVLIPISTTACNICMQLQRKFNSLLVRTSYFIIVPYTLNIANILQMELGGACRHF